MRFSRVTHRFWLRRSKIEYEDDWREWDLSFLAIVLKIVLVLDSYWLILSGSSGFAGWVSGILFCRVFCFLGFGFL